jgi:hypothetical protein
VESQPSEACAQGQRALRWTRLDARCRPNRHVYVLASYVPVK